MNIHSVPERVVRIYTPALRAPTLSDIVSCTVLGFFAFARTVVCRRYGVFVSVISDLGFRKFVVRYSPMPFQTKAFPNDPTTQLLP